jgi:CheY-like chemotaxis protein
MMPNMNRIALVEDHVRLGRLIAQALTAAGIEVDTFARIESAAPAIADNAYATAVIDRGLPDGDGIDLVRRLRRAGNAIPCLLLTARNSIHDRVDGLEAGADDYLPKPFAMAEMVARVRALMRRTHNLQALAPDYAGLQVFPEEGCMGISVRDVGPGVAPADVPRLFTRFWRSETAPHQGAGLGLSICQGIANAHGWSLGYHAPDAGPGAEFRLTFQA